MPVTLLSTIVKSFLYYGPFVLIIFSGRVSGWQKIKWALLTLVPIFVKNILIATLLAKSNASALIFLKSPYHSTYTAIYVLSWVSVWLIYFYFRAKNPKWIVKIEKQAATKAP